MENEDEINKRYPPNTFKEKSKKEEPEKKNLERIVTGEVTKRKKPLRERLAESFTGDDARSVSDYLLFDVLVPATKSLISDMFSQGIERLLFGDSISRRRPVNRSGGYTSYNKMYDRRDEPPRELSRRGRTTHSFEEVVISNRGEAEDVLDRLSDLVENYDLATVSDFYELIGIKGSYQDDKWGWVDLRRAAVRRSGPDGFYIDLPRPEPIN